MSVVAGLVAAWGVSPGLSAAISAADAVALRFPADWTGAAVQAAPRATYALASLASPHQIDAELFDPHPTWGAGQPVAPVAEAKSEPAAQPAVEPKIEPEAKAEPKAEPKVAKVEAEPKPEPTPEPKSAPVAASKSEPKAHPALVASRAPAHHPVARDSGQMFSEAQLASIKARLKLTPYQEQYWPAVASALHAIGERAAHAGPVRQASAYAGEGGLAGIDSNSPEVSQLKSAAFPLIMSMNEEQKSQVRVLARVMGLEQVASSF
jgi:hypothetical protein